MMNENVLKTAALYIRVSTDKQEELSRILKSGCY